MERLSGDLEIVCKGRGRCRNTFKIEEIDLSKVKVGDSYLAVECPLCGKKTQVTKKELGEKYDQLKNELSTKIEAGKEEVDKNFEMYYDVGDYDSIVAEGGLDKLKRYKLKDGLLDADVPEKVIDKVLKRWNQDSELHKDYGRLVLMLQSYIQDLKKLMVA